MEAQTPEETIDSVYQRIRKSLALEIIDTVRSMSPSFFERMVVELLVKMGYGGSINDAGRAVGRTKTLIFLTLTPFITPEIKLLKVCRQ